MARLASYVWKETECAIFPGVDVDCHDKKTKTKNLFLFLLCFRTNESRNFALFSCFQETKGVISSAGDKYMYCFGNKAQNHQADLYV